MRDYQCLGPSFVVVAVDVAIATCAFDVVFVVWMSRATKKKTRKPTLKLAFV